MDKTIIFLMKRTLFYIFIIVMFFLTNGIAESREVEFSSNNIFIYRQFIKIDRFRNTTEYNQIEFSGTFIGDTQEIEIYYYDSYNYKFSYVTIKKVAGNKFNQKFSLNDRGIYSFSFVAKSKKWGRVYCGTAQIKYRDGSYVYRNVPGNYSINNNLDNVYLLVNDFRRRSYEFELEVNKDLSIMAYNYAKILIKKNIQYAALDVHNNKYINLEIQKHSIKKINGLVISISNLDDLSFQIMDNSYYMYTILNNNNTHFGMAKNGNYLVILFFDDAYELYHKRDYFNSYSILRKRIDFYKYNNINFNMLEIAAESAKILEYIDDVKYLSQLLLKRMLSDYDIIKRINVNIDAGYIDAAEIILKEEMSKRNHWKLNYLEARLSFIRGDNENAILIIEKLKENEIKDAELYFLEGKIHYKMEEYFKALESFKLAYQFSSGNPDIDLNMGFTYFELDDYRKAMAYLIKVETQYPDHLKRLKVIAYSYYSVNSYKNAVDIFLKLYQMNTDDVIITKFLGYSYYELADYDSAIFYLENALKKDPYNIEIKKMLGYSLYAKEEFKSSLEYLTQSQTTNSTGDLYYVIGLNYYKLTDYKNAITSFSNAVKKKGKGVDIYPYLGKSYYYDSQYTNAIKKFKLALKYGSEPDETYYWIGHTYYKMENKRSALYYFNKLVANFPRSEYLEKSKEMVTIINNAK